MPEAAGTIPPGGVDQTSQNIPQQLPQLPGHLASHFKFLQELVAGIVVVLFIGFAGCLVAVGAEIVNYQAERAATFQDLKDQVIAQNAKIDTLIELAKQK